MLAKATPTSELDGRTDADRRQRQPLLLVWVPKAGYGDGLARRDDVFDSRGHRTNESTLSPVERPGRPADASSRCTAAIPLLPVTVSGDRCSQMGAIAGPFDHLTHPLSEAKTAGMDHAVSQHRGGEPD